VTVEKELEAALQAQDGLVARIAQLHERNMNLREEAALVCDHEADRQSLYASEAGTPGLRMIHGTAANTLMAVAQRIRALKVGVT
jgi:hypothetical protein